MKPTRSLRRRIATSPHPELSEAVTITRFWRLVDMRGRDDCWPWLGDQRDGYGVFYYRQRMRGAHELALSFTYGEKRLASLDTCHSCNNPICCNPDHLRFDTRASNVRDMMRAGTHANGFRKLTPHEVKTIRERRASGARQVDLAAQFGISQALTSLICRGHRYADVGGPIETERKYHRG